MADDAVAIPEQAAPEVQIQDSPGFVKHTRIDTQEALVAPGGKSPIADTKAEKIRKYTGVQETHKTLVDWLEDHHDDVDKVDWRISIRRENPKVYRGKKLPVNVEIDEYSLRPFAQIRDFVKENHGGGEYRLVVLDQTTQAVRQMSFAIKNENPKYVEIEEGNGSGNGEAHASSSEPLEMDDVTREKFEATKTRQVIERKRLEHERWLAEQQMEEERKQVAERRAGQPLAQEFDRKLADMKADSDRKFEALLGKITELVAKPPQDTLTPILALMMKSQETAAQMMSESMKAAAESQRMASEKNAEALKATAQIQADSSKESAKAQSMIMEKVFERAFNPPNTASDMFKWMERGEQRTLEMVERIEDAKAEAAPAYDTQASPWDNLIGAGVEFLKKHVGKDQIAGAVGRPGATEFTDVEYQQLAQKMAPHLARQMGIKPKSPAMVDAKPVTGANGMKMYEIEEMPALPASPGSNTGGSPQLQTSTNPPSLSEVTGTPEERLKFYVTQSMQEATEDATDARPAQTWVEDANNLWGDVFLEQLFLCGNDAQRIRMIQAQTDPGVYAALLAQVGPNPPKYANFMTGLKELMVIYGQRRIAAIPVQPPSPFVGPPAVVVPSPIPAPAPEVAKPLG